MFSKIVFFTFILFGSLSVPGADDGGAYPTSLVRNNVVFLLDIRDGVLQVRQWDVKNDAFVSYPLSVSARINGSVVDVSLDAADSATVLVLESRGIYSIWNIAFLARAAERLWIGHIDDEVTTLRRVTTTGAWILSGVREVYVLRGGSVCRLVSSETPLTFSAVRAEVVAVGGLLRTYSVPDHGCPRRAPLASLDIHGYAQDVAPRLHGWIAIIHQINGSRLVFLDEHLNPLSSVAVAHGLPWRLVSVGDVVVASAPYSKLAYRIDGDAVSALTLTKNLNGYACPSTMAGPIYFTDGSQIATVRELVVLSPHTMRVVFGIMMDAATVWAVTLLGAALVGLLVWRWLRH